MINKYFNKIQEELHIKRMSLKELITQRGVLGKYIEEIIRDFLINNLPKKYSVATGILLNDNGSSPECDVIIYNSSNHTPIFQSGNIIVIDPFDVLAIIEVKSKITTASVNKIKRDIEEIREIEITRRRARKVFLIGFESGLSIINLRNRLSPTVNDVFLIAKKRRRNGELIYEIVDGEIKRLIDQLSHL